MCAASAPRYHTCLALGPPPRHAGQVPLVAAVLAFVLAAPPGVELIGKPSPEWQVSDWDGAPARSLAQLRGRVVVVRFWTDGCPFCRASMPALQKLADELAGEPVLFVGLYIAKPRGAERTWSDVVAVARSWGVRFPLAYDRGWKTVDAWWLAGHDRAATSATFVIGADGRIVHVHPGPALYPSDDPAHAAEDRDYRALRAAVIAALPAARRARAAAPR